MHVQVNKWIKSDAVWRGHQLHPLITCPQLSGLSSYLPDFISLFTYHLDFLLSSSIIISNRKVNTDLWLQLSSGGTFY